MFGSFAPWLITACALKPLSKTPDRPTDLHLAHLSARDNVASKN